MSARIRLIWQIHTRFSGISREAVPSQMARTIGGWLQGHHKRCWNPNQYIEIPTEIYCFPAAIQAAPLDTAKNQYPGQILRVIIPSLPPTGGHIYTTKGHSPQGKADGLFVNVMQKRVAHTHNRAASPMGWSPKQVPPCVCVPTRIHTCLVCVRCVCRIFSPTTVTKEHVHINQLGGRQLKIDDTTSWGLVVRSTVGGRPSPYGNAAKINLRVRSTPSVSLTTAWRGSECNAGSLLLAQDGDHTGLERLPFTYR